MKDNIFEILLNLFESSLAQLHEEHSLIEDDNAKDEAAELLPDDFALHIREARQNSTRVFTYEEQTKLTKASYQFLIRMKLWQVIDFQLFEAIINKIQGSDSRVVTLQETKWAIRSILATQLNEEQLAFLDLVLYQTEDEQTIH